MKKIGRKMSKSKGMPFTNAHETPCHLQGTEISLLWLVGRPRLEWRLNTWPDQATQGIGSPAEEFGLIIRAMGSH